MAQSPKQQQQPVSNSLYASTVVSIDLGMLYPDADQHSKAHVTDHTWCSVGGTNLAVQDEARQSLLINPMQPVKDG